MHLTSLFRTRRTTETDEVISGRAAHTAGKRRTRARAPRRARSRKHECIFWSFPLTFVFLSLLTRLLRTRLFGDRMQTTAHSPIAPVARRPRSRAHSLIESEVAGCVKMFKAARRRAGRQGSAPSEWRCAHGGRVVAACRLHTQRHDDARCLGARSAALE